jgi:hypothetical protein
MFKSLSKWLNIPYKVKPILLYDGDGDKTYGIAEDYFCYIEGKTVIVRNEVGNEVVSQLQLYTNGSVVIKTTDIIVYEGKDYLMHAIAPFYDGKGNKDLQVVYL